MVTSIEDGNPPGRSKLRIVLLSCLLGLAGTGGGAYYYLNKAPSKKPPKTTAVLRVVDPIFVPLEPFTVNLQPGGRSRFLHVAVTLNMMDSKSQAQVAQYLPEVRSRVLSTLSNREAESLSTPEGKARLSGEILTALSQPFAPNLPPQKIASVMFTSFMLQ